MSTTAVGPVRISSDRNPAPQVTADRAHPRRLPGLEIDDRVADVHALARIHAQPIGGQQKWVGMGFVPLGVVLAGQDGDGADQVDGGQPELDEVGPLGRDDAAS